MVNYHPFFGIPPPITQISISSGFHGTDPLLSGKEQIRDLKR